jgi:hypothetical protein
MAATTKENGSNPRRKSMNLFSRTSLASLTQINTDVGRADGHTDGAEKKDGKKLAKRSSKLGIGSVASPVLPHITPVSPIGNNGSDSPKIR